MLSDDNNFLKDKSVEGTAPTSSTTTAPLSTTAVTNPTTLTTPTTPTNITGLNGNLSIGKLLRIHWEHGKTFVRAAH